MIEFSGYKHSDYPDVFVLEVMGHIDTEASEFLLSCIQGYIAM